MGVGVGAHLVASLCLVSRGVLFLAFGQIPRQPMSSRITRLYHTGTPEGRDPRSPLTAPRRNTGGWWKRLHLCERYVPWRTAGSLTASAPGMLRRRSPPCLPLPQPPRHSPGNLLGAGQPREPPLSCQKVKHKSWNFCSLEKCSGGTLQE